MQISEVIFNRYVLNENYTGSGGVSLGGIIINPNTNNDFKDRKQSLDGYIRNKANPNGILDYIQITQSGKVLNDTKKYFSEIPEIKSRETLCTLSREALEDIAKHWDIETYNKVDKWLINEILKAQTSFLELDEDVDEEDVDENTIHLKVEDMMEGI